MFHRKKNKKQVHIYECTITGEKFKRNEEAKHPDELVSVKAYYELNPDDDDRPQVIKKKLETEQA